MAPSKKQAVLGILKQRGSYAFVATCDGDQPVVQSNAPISEDDLRTWVAASATADKVSQIKGNPSGRFPFPILPDGETCAAVFGRAQALTDPEAKGRAPDPAAFSPVECLPEGPQSPGYGLLRIIPTEIRQPDNWGSGEKVHGPPKD